MRLALYFALAAALLFPAVASAQQITIGGWVQRVDVGNATITVRTLDNPRTIPVAPNAVIRVNGVVSTLGQLPFNSSVSILAEKGPDGVVRATAITAQSMTRQPAAAAPPGAIVRGTLVGMNIPNGMITVRTRAGDYPVSLGTAPIYVNGHVGSNRDLRIGETIEVDRSLPTAASSDFVTQAIRITTNKAPATNARVGTRGTAARGAASTAATSSATTSGVHAMAGAGVQEHGVTVYGAPRSSVAAYRVRRTRTTVRSRTRRRAYRPRVRRRTRRRVTTSP